MVTQVNTEISRGGLPTVISSASVPYGYDKYLPWLDKEWSQSGGRRDHGILRIHGELSCWSNTDKRDVSAIKQAKQ